MTEDKQKRSKIYQPQISRDKGDSKSWSLITSILHEIKAAKDSKKKPLLVMDLDSTLINTSFRTANIFNEYAQSEQNAKKYPDLCQKIAEWETVTEIFYPEEFVARHCGLILQIKPENTAADTDTSPLICGDSTLSLEHAKELRKWWMKRFFNPHYLQHDRAYSHATEFIENAIENGASIAYLTGRNHNGVYDATLESLTKMGFPVDVPGVCLQLKPDSENDLDYKGRELKKLSEGFDPVWFIDNEAHLISMSHREHKNVTSIFFDSVHSGLAEISDQNIPSIKSWKKP